MTSRNHSQPPSPIGARGRGVDDEHPPTCVITGASSGIGRATARAFARRGYRLVLAARRAEQLEKTLRLCGGAGRIVVCDISDRDQVRALAASVAEHEGACHVLVNNAGVGSHVPYSGPEAGALLERIMRVNFFGAAWLTGDMMPLLERSAPSSVVNVSSVAGLVGVPDSPIYSASKFALTGFSESMHHALRERGVHVACVHPGPVPTEGFPHVKLAGQRSARRLISTPDEVAELIVRSSRPGSDPTPVIPELYGWALRIRALSPRIFRYVVRTASQHSHRWRTR